MEEIERDQFRMAKWARESKLGFSAGVNGSTFEFTIRITVGGCSSVGRAVALQAIGQEFESPQLHQTAWKRQSVECASVPDLSRSNALTFQRSDEGPGV